MMIEKDAKVCPVCQYEFPSGMSPAKWVAIGLVILFLFYMLLGVLR